MTILGNTNNSAGRRVRESFDGLRRYLGPVRREDFLMVMTGCIVGVITGSIAAALKQLCSLIALFCMRGHDTSMPDWHLLVYPLLGILLTWLFQRYVVGTQCGNCTFLIQRNIEKGKAYFSPFMMFNPFMGCAMTIGMGASGGQEGPMALCGAAVGSNVSRMLGLTPEWRFLTMVIGGGAGIAAIFKAPIGGVLFALEGLQVEFTSIPMLTLIIACILASTTASLFSGFTTDIIFSQTMKTDLHLMGWVALLGIFCGLYSIYFKYTCNHTAGYFLKMKRRWLAAICTGVVMSASVFLFPALYGTGLDVVGNLVNGLHDDFLGGGLFTSRSGDMTWILCGVAAMLMLKGALVGAAFSGGGVSGTFLPTLFAGALCGFLFGNVVDLLFEADLPVWYFSLMGMAAVMAGTLHVPLMAIFITCEATDTAGYMLAYLVAVGFCYLVVRVAPPRSYFSTPEGKEALLYGMWKQTPALRNEDNMPPDQKLP